MAARSRIAAVVARLLRRDPSPIAAVDSLDPVLAAGGLVVVPGLSEWLGYTPRTADPDFNASVDDGFTESFEDFCARISRTEAAS